MYKKMKVVASKAKRLLKRANEESANMSAATPTVFLVFYRFKAMSDQEAQKSSLNGMI
jgi:hypothetical protein